MLVDKIGSDNMEDNKTLDQLIEKAQELLIEAKAKTSSFQSTLSHLENLLKAIKNAKEENVQLESATESASEDLTEETVYEKPTEENVDLKMSEFNEEKQDEPVIDDTIKLSMPEEIGVEEALEQTDLSPEEGKTSETKDVDPDVKLDDKVYIDGFKPSPSNIASVKGFFTPEELHSIINRLETAPTQEEATSEAVVENQSVSLEEQTTTQSNDLPSSTSEDEVVMSQLNNPSDSKESADLEQIENSSLDTNPEMVAENLAENYEDKDQILNELLEKMRQEFDGKDVKGR